MGGISQTILWLVLAGPGPISYIQPGRGISNQWREVKNPRQATTAPIIISIATQLHCILQGVSKTNQPIVPLIVVLKAFFLETTCTSDVEDYAVLYICCRGLHSTLHLV